MSAYQEYTTQFKDAAVLVEALCAMKWRTGTLTAADIEVHEEAVALCGYHGDVRSQRANIIIRRAKVGSASNDIGFVRQEDGTYRAIISQYDRGYHNEAFVDLLSQTYAEKMVEQKAKAKGYRVQKQKLDDGKIRMTLSRWR